MLPHLIPHYAVGPFFGFATNLGVLALCLLTMLLYRNYQPLRKVFFFYLLVTIFFLGWYIQELQHSTWSIFWAYKISQAALALLPASWALFMMALFGEKTGAVMRGIIGLSVVLALAAVLGNHPWLYGLPLQPHPLEPGVLRPQSQVLKPIIYSFCLLSCFYFFILAVLKARQRQAASSLHLWLFTIGLLSWFMGGVHDALLSFGIALVIDSKILWFASFGLSMFITAAVALHFRDVEQVACRELENLNLSKDKALHLLSHELKTPLAVIKGNIKLLKRKLMLRADPHRWARFFEALDRQVNRLLEIQQQAEVIIRDYGHGQQAIDPAQSEAVAIYPLAEQTLDFVRHRAVGRSILLSLEGNNGLQVQTDAEIIKDVLEGLLRNAIENTPDGGCIRVIVENDNNSGIVKVADSGIGITEKNLAYIFSGLHSTLEADFYTTKKQYEFNAGGKGLDLLRMRVLGRHYGFEISVRSRRCPHLPTDNDLCPGKISNCIHCRSPRDCLQSGGTTFRISLPLAH